MTTVNVAEAKARLSELMARAEAGEDIRIQRRGQPSVRLVSDKPVKKFDWDALKAFTDTLPVDPSDSVVEMRRQARF